MIETVRKPPQIALGSANSTAWLFSERNGTPWHAALSIHPDGSGSLTVYSHSGTDKVRPEGSVGFDRAGAQALLTVLKSHLESQAQA